MLINQGKELCDSSSNEQGRDFSSYIFSNLSIGH